ncbi:uncharacterized protein LOC133706797 [Rosa rugosa]|uniref:uncharacterized protein LOC133706797 n=1 Tax=Rosa rugosa TaxID=74645 RepID=UPI002B41669F|nr:uncharacterized protein LOC133706797 [Rosa rugosa]
MLKDLPEDFYKLRCFRTLVLSGCSRFENLSQDIGNMISLKTLVICGTSISEVPSSVDCLRNLDFSSRQGLSGLKRCDQTSRPRLSLWGFLYEFRFWFLFAILVVWYLWETAQRGEVRGASSVGVSEDNLETPKTPPKSEDEGGVCGRASEDNLETSKTPPKNEDNLETPDEEWLSLRREDNLETPPKSEDNLETPKILVSLFGW